MAVNPKQPEIDDEDAPEPMDDFGDEDNPDDEDEQYAVPESLLKAAGITSDEDWDEIPEADLEAMKAARKAGR